VWRGAGAKASIPRRTLAGTLAGYQVRTLAGYQVRTLAGYQVRTLAGYQVNAARARRRHAAHASARKCKINTETRLTLRGVMSYSIAWPGDHARQ
jgi:hypothetical protein